MKWNTHFCSFNIAIAAGVGRVPELPMGPISSSSGGSFSGSQEKSPSGGMNCPQRSISVPAFARTVVLRCHGCPERGSTFWCRPGLWMRTPGFDRSEIFIGRPGRHGPWTSLGCQPLTRARSEPAVRHLGSETGPFPNWSVSLWPPAHRGLSLPELTGTGRGDIDGD